MEDYIKHLIVLQQQQAKALERIAIALERMAPDAGAPNLQKPISQFKSFDWASIGSSVVQRDEHGPAIVEWGGKQFTRRSPQNKYDPAIWFSRSTGERNGEGTVIYERLITFKTMSDVEPIGRKAAEALA